MDDTELHYLTYDPDEMLRDMMLAYTQAGGDLLYPGDEKEMLLRAVLQIMVQAFAGIDNALRMDTLRYAVRDYLDLYGEKRNCIRIPAKAATATVKITVEATGKSGKIDAGTAITADGSVMYLTEDDITLSGIAQEITADVICARTGSIGNGLTDGTQMQSVAPIDGVVSVVCTTSASGGQDEETDEAYRERIRTFGLSSVSTGPQSQYESAVKAVSSEIIDARALRIAPGKVGIYLIHGSQTGLDALIKRVEQALNDVAVRPLTDQIQVAAATPVPYTLNVRYSHDGSANIQSLAAESVNEYKTWQEQTIGRAFNPDKLAAMLYQAGATRVLFGAGSEFNGGSVEYTEIEASEYCKGNISLAVIDG